MRRWLRLMKQFCKEHGVNYEECGKLVVATAPEEVQRLHQLHERGLANGVEGLRMLADRDNSASLNLC